LNTDKQHKRGPGRPPTVKPLSPNLVSTWKAIVTRNNSLTSALKTMNLALEMKLTHSRITEWERERKAPSPMVINYMLSTVIMALLLDEGTSEAEAYAIAAQIRVPGL